MNKIFKRSVLGAAIVMTVATGSANAAIELAGENVVLYGQAAGSLQYWSADGKNKEDTVDVEIETRLGLRGKVSFDEIAPAFVWQAETGNADNTKGSNNDGLGAFGGRDTYVGFEFDGFGQIKYGRQLVATYDYVDWPHTNPGLGNVFDWHNAIDAKYQDRASDTIRYDSANWGGFKVQATLSGMTETTEAAVSSIAAGYTGDGFNIHAGYYHQGEYDVRSDKEGENGKVTGQAGDVSYAIIGGSFTFDNFTFTAAYKPMWNDTTDDSQNAYSVTAAYMVDQTWVYKIGYAATDESDKGKNDDSQAITGRIMYLLPSTALYFDVRNYDMMPDDKWAIDPKDANDGTRIMFGAEYYF